LIPHGDQEYQKLMGYQKLNQQLIEKILLSLALNPQLNFQRHRSLVKMHLFQ